MAATTPRIKARELAKCVALPVGVLVAAVSETVPLEVAERLVVRELEAELESELVEPSVCELNVVLREIGTPVPVEGPGVTDLIEEFADAGTKVDVPE